MTWVGEPSVWTRILQLVPRAAHKVVAMNFSGGRITPRAHRLADRGHRPNDLRNAA